MIFNDLPHPYDNIYSALNDYQCGVKEPLQKNLQHGLEGCEYIE